VPAPAPLRIDAPIDQLARAQLGMMREPSCASFDQHAPQQRAQTPDGHFTALMSARFRGRERAGGGVVVSCCRPGASGDRTWRDGQARTCPIRHQAAAFLHPVERQDRRPSSSSRPQLVASSIHRPIACRHRASRQGLEDQRVERAVEKSADT
jgi:hypothetical protein